MKRIPRILVLAAAIGLALAGVAAAQSEAPTPAQQKELDAARAELDRATMRYIELNKRYGYESGIRIQQPTLRKPLLGVLLAPDEDAGVRIVGVTPGGAAAAAGLENGDRLVSLDGNAITGTDGDARLTDLRTKLDKLDAKTPVRVGYSRDGKNAVVAVTPRIAENVFVWDGGDGPVGLSGDVSVLRRPDGSVGFEADRITMSDPPGIAPDIRREVIRIGDGDAHTTHNTIFVPNCKGKTPCAQPMLLMDAFRWNGLNLASLDSTLGKYFGTDKGVLVLSPGPQLPELQAGDVIRSIDGKPVMTPREAMDALRAHQAGDKASLALLRDHRDTSAQVTVPKAMPLPIPPAPPAPPAPPPPPGVGAMPAPPAAPNAPTAPRMVERRHVVVVDDNGKRMEWDDDGSVPPPPAPPAPPTGDIPAPPAPPAPPSTPED